MTIDWITVAAQIANFLVLVWLLKRFLYRPILDGIDAREAEIKTRMHAAEETKAEAAATQADYHDRERALRAAETEMSETIRKSAEDQRDALLADAHQRMEREWAEWKTSRDEEARKYTARMHRVGADALLALTRKALADLANETLEDRMAQHLVVQLEPMARDLKNAAGNATEAVVSSRDPLAMSTQDTLVAALKIIFPEVAATFTADESQTPGLVLRIGGAQLAWTVDSYIDGLDALIGAQLANGELLEGTVEWVVKLAWNPTIWCRRS